MSLDHVPIFPIRRRGFPAIGDSAFEQLVGCWMFVPDGDRRHGSESRGVVHEKDIAIGNDHIVREFILRDHLGNNFGMDICFRLSCSPSQNIRQAFVSSDGVTFDLAKSSL